MNKIVEEEEELKDDSVVIDEESFVDSREKREEMRRALDTNAEEGMNFFFIVSGDLEIPKILNQKPSPFPFIFGNLDVKSLIASSLQLGVCPKFPSRTRFPHSFTFSSISNHDIDLSTTDFDLFTTSQEVVLSSNFSSSLDSKPIEENMKDT
ncbi:hypothetical protein RJT34_25494 [Clitoria ternatea]|uniref:Uncharacterized protein n=1 Tax=Clitoria ternatea TaxID=43366 RepID=A0AAN9FQ27_CLITE